MGFSRLLCALLLVSASCSSPKNASSAADTLPASALKPFGRTAYSETQGLELVGSACQFGFSFEGKEVRIEAGLPSWLDHNYFQYELDGVYQRRIRISAREGGDIVIAAPSGGKHTVWVYKATEAHTGPVFIRNIRGKGLEPLERPQAPLIEFIGNSITCGAAADPSEVPCGAGEYHDQHNAYMAYGPRVARALGLNYFLSSVSGIGIYRNWNSEGPAMPQVYESLDFQPNASRPWNFGLYSPDVVSIALGTNDLSRGDGKTARLPFDSARFVSNYIRFIGQVRLHYPNTQIALLSSPMTGGNDRLLLQRCLTAVKTSVDAGEPAAKPLALFFFAPMQARGCSGHPNVEDHAILAKELEPFFRSLLNR